MKQVLAKIEQANDRELEQIMRAVERRYATAFPEWDVIYTAVHKDPTLRSKALYELVAHIEKDLKWNEEQQKRTPSGEGVCMNYL